MTWLLLLGIILAAGPILGFAVVGSIMLYSALKDDGDGMQVVTILVASVGIGLVFLGVYFAFRYLV